ncbi:MAG: hypothetical protein JKP98_22240 [Rhodobacteraceae bacterium]|nr:hypothetical protein [Paracoccaceae bacterium]
MPNGGPNDDGRTVFDAYVLLSEPIRFHPSEIIAALTEDYPALDIRCPEGLEQTGELDALCDTDRFITVPLMLWQGVDQGIVSLIRLPGYGTWDPMPLTPISACGSTTWPTRCGKTAPISAFRSGARRRSDQPVSRRKVVFCIAAVFARLPVALAVYWEKAGHFLSPARRSRWPIRRWRTAGRFALDRIASQTRHA